MDMESLRLVTLYSYIPIYKFKKNALGIYNQNGIAAYNPLRTLKKDRAMVFEVDVVVRIQNENTEVSRRNRMKERVLVRA